MQQSYKLLAISHWLLDTRITEETLPHVPIPSFGGANALNYAIGFEVGKVLNMQCIILSGNHPKSFMVFSLLSCAKLMFSPYFSSVSPYFFADR